MYINDELTQRITFKINCMEITNLIMLATCIDKKIIQSQNTRIPVSIMLWYEPDHNLDLTPSLLNRHTWDLNILIDFTQRQLMLVNYQFNARIISLDYLVPSNLILSTYLQNW